MANFKSIPEFAEVRVHAQTELATQTISLSRCWYIEFGYVAYGISPSPTLLSIRQAQIFFYFSAWVYNLFIFIFVKNFRKCLLIIFKVYECTEKDKITWTPEILLKFVKMSAIKLVLLFPPLDADAHADVDAELSYVFSELHSDCYRNIWHNRKMVCSLKEKVLIHHPALADNLPYYVKIFTFLWKYFLIFFEVTLGISAIGCKCRCGYRCSMDADLIVEYLNNLGSCSGCCIHTATGTSGTSGKIFCILEDGGHLHVCWSATSVICKKAKNESFLVECVAVMR